MDFKENGVKVYGRRIPNVQIPMDADCYSDLPEVDEYGFLWDHSDDFME